MTENRTRPVFTSILAERMTDFLAEKQAQGYSYHRQGLSLQRLDRQLCALGLSDEHLPRDVVEQWTAAQPPEKPANQRHRVNVIRQFALYLRRCGIDAYVPPKANGPVGRAGYVPYIFSHEEISHLLESVDGLQPEGHSPERYIVMPEIFRLLYGCGLRVSEALQLRVHDVDLERGVLTIRDAKFGKDRLVPIVDSMRARLLAYSARLLVQAEPDDYFFPAPDKTAYHRSTVYGVFRNLLWSCGISHGGRGKGPRLHDIRHSFAVHCLERWYREEADLNAKLPYLSAYMGHRGPAGTERYLRLTARVFPDIVQRMEAFAGNAMPRRLEP